MEAEVVAAIIAGSVSLLGFVVTTIWNRQMLFRQLDIEHDQWQESFRAQLRSDLMKENAVRIMQARLDCYVEVWQTLTIMTGYHVRRSGNLESDIQELAFRLTEFAYGKPGLLMSDRSRRLLNHLRGGCGEFLRGELEIREVQNRSHVLKHSMRSDIGIEDYEYESEVMAIASKLGRVDDWR